MNTHIDILLWVGLLSGATLILAGLPPQVSVGSTKLTGVHEFSIAGNPDQNVPSRAPWIKQIGAQVVRYPFGWWLMEPDTKGQTPQWLWDLLDREVAAAEAAAIKLIFEMGQTPCWASPAPAARTGPCSALADQPDKFANHPPINPKDYGDALGRVAARYKGRILAYEIWNEPNLGYTIQYG